MKADLKLVKCEDKRYWDEFVNTSAQGNIFCSSLFLDCLEVDYEFFLVKKVSQIKLGALVLKERDGEVIASPYAFSMYQGVLLDKSLDAADNHSRVPDTLKTVDYLLMELEKIYPRISFCLHHEFRDLRSFLWFHYHQPELGRFTLDLQYSGLIDLQGVADFESYLQDIRTTRRYEYRKAKDCGLLFEVSQDVEKLNQLHELTFKRQGIARGEREARLLKNIAKQALSAGFGELLLCRDAKGEAISATLYLFDRMRAYYLFGANHPDHRQAYSGTFLMLENIKRCMEKGISLIDVCGINSPNRGDFKASFNAQPRPYFIANWQKPSAESR